MSVQKNCKFRHPDDDQNESTNKLKPYKKPLNQRLIFGDNSQTDDDMINALLMGGITMKMNQNLKQSGRKRRE